MTNDIKAGCIIKTKFTDALQASKSAHNTFKSYIDYIDRNEAIRNEAFHIYDMDNQFQDYNNYMDNPNKSTGLFTEHLSSLDGKQRKALKQAFSTAYENNNIMWQTVISFDNRFLEQLGVYDKETGIVNEKRLQGATRSMMRETFKRENLTDTAIWSAAVHYNTDNIHIHIAYTEPYNTRRLKEIDGVKRPDGYFKKATIRGMKSKVVNHLLEYDFQQLDNIARKKFVNEKKDYLIYNDAKLFTQWNKVYKKLPKDKRLWQYNMNAIKDVRPALNKLTKEYLMRYYPKSYQQYYKELVRKQSVYKTAYGESSKQSNYVDNKLDDLYTRMGNVILKEMKDYDRQSSIQARMEGNKKLQKQFEDRHLTTSLGQLKNALAKTFDNEYQNEYEHEKLQHDIEMHR